MESTDHLRKVNKTGALIPENLFWFPVFCIAIAFDIGRNHVYVKFHLLNCIVRDCNQFTYNNIIYKQLEGVPMGLPISPILADIVMEYIFDKALDNSNLQVKTCVKYVDDLFLVVSHQLIDRKLSAFNYIHKNIQFTHEIE